jgi:hypothetical protein
MADTNNPGVPGKGDGTPNGPNKGQIYGGKQGDQSADLQNNQAAAVRSSGDQNPSDIAKSDRDRQDTPSTTPGS